MLMSTDCRARKWLHPGANKLEGRCRNGAFQHHGPCDSMSSPRWLLPGVSVPRMSSFASCSLGDSPSSSFGSDPGFCQITASALGPGGWDCACAPSLLGLPKVSPTGPQSQMLWGTIFLVQDPWSGETNLGLRLSLLGENCYSYSYSSICGPPTVGVGDLSPPARLIVVPSLHLYS